MSGTCGRCHQPIPENDGFVVYHREGGHDERSKDRIVACGECIAEDIAAGILRRVSSFAFEPNPPAPVEEMES